MEPPAGSVYRATGTHGGDTSLRRAEPPRLTSLESALALADYWRAKTIALMEENLLLRRRIAEAGVEVLRLAQGKEE